MYLLKAMEAIQHEVPKAKLVIIGEGPLRTELVTVARKSLRDCQFLGSQPHSAVLRWMERSALLCAPSVEAVCGDTEGLPIVVLEAQALGLPIVASVSAGIPEAVEHGVTGLLAPERDWESLARHLKALLTDEPAQRRFSLAARESVCQKFDLRRQTAVLENIYDDIREQWQISAGS